MHQFVCTFVLVVVFFVFCIIVTNLALWLPKTNKAYLLTYQRKYTVQKSLIVHEYKIKVGLFVTLKARITHFTHNLSCHI